jgi:hypothetical protein
MIAKWYAAVSVAPIAVFLLSPIVLSQQPDQLGFRPVFIGAFVAIVLSAVLTIVGVGLLIAYRNNRRRTIVYAIGTLISSIPVALLLSNLGGAS